MVLIISSSECPQCCSEAIEHFCYNTGKYRVACTKCRYKKSCKEVVTKEKREFQISDDFSGLGITGIVKKNGFSHYYIHAHDTWMKEEEMKQFKMNLAMSDTDKNKSFFMTYKYNTFFVIYGKLPENFIEIYNKLVETYNPAPVAI